MVFDLLNNQAPIKKPAQPYAVRVLIWSGREDLNLYEPTVE